MLVITDDKCVLGVASAVGKLRLAGITVSAVGYQALNATTVDLFASSGGGEAYMIDDGAELAGILAAQSASGAPEVRAVTVAPAAVVFLIDRSGSNRGEMLDAEKALVRVGIESLADTDTVAVIAFDSEATVIERAQRLTNRRRILSSVAKIEAKGGTDLEPGLKEAFELLKAVNAQTRHVFLLTDGDTNLEGIVELVIQMKLAKILVSLVGMPGGDSVQLREIATSGGGRLLSHDPSELPKAIAETLDRAAR